MGDVFFVREDLAAIGDFEAREDAQQRRLAGAGRPSRAHSDPVGISRLTRSRATKAPKRLETSLTVMLMGVSSPLQDAQGEVLRTPGIARHIPGVRSTSPLGLRFLFRADFPLQRYLDDQRHQSQQVNTDATAKQPAMFEL